jgi:glycosyltransferase involved in cell wall biosynthesis
MPPLVSVVIPCLNLEIIVVDNGSTDASLEVAQRYESSITLLACNRIGASAARNVGLTSARGDFIQFLDADDILDRDKVQAQMRRLAGAAPSSIASGAWARFRSDPTDAAMSAEPVWRDLAPRSFSSHPGWAGG